MEGFKRISKLAQDEQHFLPQVTTAICTSSDESFVGNPRCWPMDATAGEVDVHPAATCSSAVERVLGDPLCRPMVAGVVRALFIRLAVTCSSTLDCVLGQGRCWPLVDAEANVLLVHAKAKVLVFPAAAAPATAPAAGFLPIGQES